MEESPPRELGPQPLDRLLEELGLCNRDLVAASPDQLTHKQVQKARKGRRLTANIQRKILRALERAASAKGAGAEGLRIEDLFNYRA